MNINIKHVINIINNDQIAESEKEKYVYYFFEERSKAIQGRPQENFVLLKRKLKFLVDTINNRLTDDYKDCVFYCHYEDEVKFDTNCELFYNDREETISEWAYNDYYVCCCSCGENYHVDNTDYINHGHWCSSCRDDEFFWCDNCDEYISNSESCDCDNEGDEENNLYAYNYRIPLLNLGNSDLRYGIELEMEVREDYYRSDTVEEIRSVMNKNVYSVQCKRDGSLCEYNGFELVSTNADFYYHKNKFWNDFFKLNLNESCKGYHGKDCGYHIHMSRNAFDESQMQRLNCFYNDKKNRNFLIDISGRNQSSYAKFKDDIDLNSPVFTDGDDYKYRAINFNNTSTIEVRIFRSNLKKISFFRNLELVHSINDFIQNDKSTNSIYYTEYFDFLLNNPNKDYVNLLLWLDDKDYFSHLEHVEDFKTRYNDFKNIVEDFRTNNQELINLESEDN